MSTFRWSIERADPGHLKLKVLVLAILVGDIDDTSGLLDTLFEG